MRAAKKRILFVEQSMDGTVGGSHTCLLDMLANLDRERFEPLVLLHEANPLLSQFESLAETLVIPPRDAWHLISKLHGISVGPPAVAPMLLQKALNVVRVPLGSVMRWRRILARHRIDLVHMNNTVFRVGEWVLAARMTGTRIACHQRGFGSS